MVTSTTAIVRWGLWFAFLTGLGQALLVGMARLSTDRIVMIKSDVVWMAPLTNAVIFTIAALIVGLCTLRIERVKAASVALFVFVFLMVIAPLLMVPRLHRYAAVVLGVGLAIQTVRILRPRLDTFDKITRWTLPVLVIGSALLGGAVHLKGEVVARRAEGSLPQAQSGAPNVILIVLDTVRATSLSTYGYQRQTSPHLDEFAKSGIVFERALSTSPWTLPSHASFFTGRLPHELTASWLTPLDEKFPTIAETFTARGYVTTGFVANLLYSTAETGLDRGFIRYVDFPLSPSASVAQSWLARMVVNRVRSTTSDTDLLVRKSAADINEEFLTWLEHRPQRPFFAFLNYFDAHEPYLPPPPFDTKFGPGGPAPPLEVRRHWSRAEIQRSNDAYDGALAYLDEQLGVLLTKLKEKGLLENSLVVITSDHGEQFGEHGLFDHGNGLYRQVLHVPLVFSFPSKLPMGVRVPNAVSLINLPATILEIAGPAPAAGALPGQSLARYWSSPAAGDTEPLFSEVRKAINMPAWLPASKGDMRSVVADGKHYIRNGDGSEELYDFERDINEEHNLSRNSESAADLERMRRLLEIEVDRK